MQLMASKCCRNTETLRPTNVICNNIAAGSKCCKLHWRCLRYHHVCNTFSWRSIYRTNFTLLALHYLSYVNVSALRIRNANAITAAYFRKKFGIVFHCIEIGCARIIMLASALHIHLIFHLCVPKCINGNGRSVQPVIWKYFHCQGAMAEIDLGVLNQFSGSIRICAISAYTKGRRRTRITLTLCMFLTIDYTQASAMCFA